MSETSCPPAAANIVRLEMAGTDLAAFYDVDLGKTGLIVSRNGHSPPPEP